MFYKLPYPLSIGTIFTLELLILLFFLSLMFYKFKSTGVVIYNALAIIIANIQVLKTVTILDMQIALGTTVFASTYIATEILTEHYGKQTAKTCIYIGFLAQIIFAIMMMVTILYPSADKLINNSMINIFSPTLRLTISSLLAYLASQIADIICFAKLKQITNHKMLWLRSNIANIVATTTDSIIFNLLAWIVLNPNILSVKQVFFTYMLPGFIARIFVGFIATPVLYLSYKLNVQ